MSTTAVGTFDQPNRWSNAETTKSAKNISTTPELTTFCTGRDSWVGPAFIRRRSTSGVFTPT